MSIIAGLIAKSEENWTCVNLLTQGRTAYVNVAVSRMYYSIFLLVKSAMVLNNEKSDLPSVAKMSIDSATGSHKLAKEYLFTLTIKLGMDYQVLIRMREQADYDPLPVTKKDFDDVYKVWSVRRAEFVHNLQKIGRLLP